jgi:adenylosuccinate synthase
MAKTACAVIGAGFGDEGKGLITDAVAHAFGPATLVVRTNGGAQAGHTVARPDGTRHVFHHVASGALAGAATHLSRFFVHHPMLLASEVRALWRLSACTSISADPRGYVTTPWDMIVNQIAEEARGNGRHGSCGYGFGETVGRCEETPYRITLADLACAHLPDRLLAIRDEWAPARLRTLGIDSISPENQALLRSDAVLNHYLDDIAEFLSLVRIAPDASIGDAAALVFEGAQGLMLDQHHGAFPFVTRSSTGLPNMRALAAEAGIDRIDAIYVTRCYMTRHGRGPMPNEGDISRQFTIVDPTNKPNPWQESLRFGHLDLDVLGGAISKDLIAAHMGTPHVVPHLAVTCLDQAPGLIPVRQGASVRRLKPDVLIRHLVGSCGAQSVSTAQGPTREQVSLAPFLGPTAPSFARSVYAEEQGRSA